jgi:anthranilate synthase/aminodeoxychorismate synthase-like glutamine amidotransferase
MIVVVDNYDSFTWNLVQLVESLTEMPLKVIRNDAFDPGELIESKPRGIIISPGPGTPERAGRSIDLVRRNQSIPLLGVCLGHQAIAVALGGRVGRGPVPVHGKPSRIEHEGRRLFQGCPVPMTAIRYHSLVIERDSLPDELEVDAVSDDGVVMAISHRERPLFGVQFHPESYGTEGGGRLMENFLRLVGKEDVDDDDRD